MSRSFLTADVHELVRKLNADEKIALLGAPNWWNTTSIERLQIPAIRMSDGPNGVRGSSHLIQTPAQCLPCATALASTFDPELIHAAGELLAEEAKVKSSVVLLAPTCNLQRNPLGGRAFESFSEDPHLSGTMSAAYVNGLQSRGVSATIKHFVANDQEDERTAAESVMTDRALREVYLYPFMWAEKHAKPWAYMTSYGRINGIHCSESEPLLQGILREEWGFKGIVMSDWFGTYSVDIAVTAGLDLEMPGPPRWRTPLLMNHCLTAQKLLMPTLDERVTTLLTFVQDLARRNPEVVYGDGKEGSNDSPASRAFARRLAAESLVLLKNEQELLPLKEKRLKRIAIIGPNAKQSIVSGGGSAALKPTYVVTPYDGLLSAAPDSIDVKYHVGCYSHKYTPTLDNYITAPSGERGWLCSFHNFAADGKPGDKITSFVLTDTRIKLNDTVIPGLDEEYFLKVTAKLTMPETAKYELGLTVAGRAKLYINGQLTIDNWTKQTPGDFFYGQGTIEEKAVFDFEAGKSVDIIVEYTNTSPPVENGEGKSSQPALMRGVRLGGCVKIDPVQAISEAVSLAREVDAVVFVAGLTPEWESEGFDRTSLALPGRQDETIAALAEANPNIVVVIQAGSAVSMPWSSDVRSIIQAWYLGNECGNALADVIFGRINPSGRLPLSFPKRVEDIPAYPNLRSENGQIHYMEDVFVGYKNYQSKSVEPLFPFGHGLSYTEFKLGEVVVTGTLKDADSTAHVTVEVQNVGPTTGSEVIQVYISYPDTGISQPPLQLRGYAKARDVAPGKTVQVRISLDKFAVAYWDTRANGWKAHSGEYGVHVGFSSAETTKLGDLKVTRGFGWKGL